MEGWFASASAGSGGGSGDASGLDSLLASGGVADLLPSSFDSAQHKAKPPHKDSNLQDKNALPPPESAEQSRESRAKFGAFKTMQLDENVLRGIKHAGYTLPTPIQRKAIPLLLAGRDVVAMARTGSGKTAAFVIPILEKLHRHSERMGARALIIAPTRELAEQTHKFCQQLGRHTTLRAVLVVGGESMQDQFADLAANPDIIVATPGRLVHLIHETGLSLSAMEFVVFDEADRLFEMGFQEDVTEILRSCTQSVAGERASLESARHQTALFSATMPTMLVEFARAGLRNPELVRLDSELTLPDTLKVQFLTCRRDEKVAALLWLLGNGYVSGTTESTIVFVSTRHHAEFLFELLTARHFAVSVVYGTMDQTARKISVSKFRNGIAKIMIVTDVAARGIDIPMLDNVINFDFPGKPKVFVHRCGRAARMGRTGIALSLVSPDELPYMIDLYMFLGYGAPKNRVPAGEEFHEADVYYGGLPQDEIDVTNESVREQVDAAIELKSQLRVAGNAYKLYSKTRAQPSTESVRRAKNMATDAIHPLVFYYEMQRAGPGATAALVARQDQLRLQHSFVNDLKAFRPPSTIFEIDRKKKLVKSSRQGGDSIPMSAAVMAAKRREHGHIVKVERERASKRKSGDSDRVMVTDLEHKRGEKRPSPGDNDQDLDGLDIAETVAAAPRILAPPKKKARGVSAEDFRDGDFFINHAPELTKRERWQEKGLSLADDAMSRGNDDVVFDLGASGAGGDESTGLRRAQQVRKWDRKKKKFIQVNAADANATSAKHRKNEAGSAVSKKARAAAQGKIYEDWKKRSHAEIGRIGEMENSSFSRQRMDHNREKAARGGKIWHTSGAESGDRSSVAGNRDKRPNELKSADQIGKERRVKEKREEYLKIKRSGKKPQSKAGSNIPRPSLRFKGQASTRSKKIVGGKISSNRKGGKR